MKKIAISILFVLIFCNINAGVVRYSDICDFAKEEMMEYFTESVKESEMLLVRSGIGDLLDKTNGLEWCSAERRRSMMHNGYYPCRMVRNCLPPEPFRPKWICCLRYGHGLNGGEEISRMRKGAFRPALCLPADPLLALSKETNESEHRDSAYSFVGNLAFAVDGLGNVDSVASNSEERHRKTSSEEMTAKIGAFAKMSNREHPPITLTRQEATELVYVTALCKGKAGNAAEFNAMYRDDNLGFIMELKSDSCETAFGRDLYEAAREKGLVVGAKPKEF